MKQEIFISTTTHNTVSIYVSYKSIEEMDSTLWSMIIIAMESWAVWKTSIGVEYTGWEFSKDFTPQMIQNAFKKVSGILVPIV